jgi:hypothetical protein
VWGPSHLRDRDRERETRQQKRGKKKWFSVVQGLLAPHEWEPGLLALAGDFQKGPEHASSPISRMHRLVTFLRAAHS